jgi:hypothetical protein
MPEMTDGVEKYVNIKKTTKVCEDMKIAFEDDEQYTM